MYNSWKKFPEQCFAITLSIIHAVQAQILHITNARLQCRPDWALSGACSVHNAYMKEYIIIDTTWHVTSSIQMLLCYVQFSGKVGDGGS